ncbi:hypothetical protein BDR03DRAFT_987211 [Suillus americanus]|nr:hypothetical protein BDR03DRAFT_987211 [Suillus americanus]
MDKLELSCHVNKLSCRVLAELYFSVTHNNGVQPPTTLGIHLYLKGCLRQAKPLLQPLTNAGKSCGRDGARDLPNQGSCTPELKDDTEDISADCMYQVMEDMARNYKFDTTGGLEKESRAYNKLLAESPASRRMQQSIMSGLNANTTLEDITYIAVWTIVQLLELGIPIDWQHLPFWSFEPLDQAAHTVTYTISDVWHWYALLASVMVREIQLLAQLILEFIDWNVEWGLLDETGEFIGTHCWEEEVLRETGGDFPSLYHASLRQVVYDAAIAAGAELRAGRYTGCLCTYEPRN